MTRVIAITGFLGSGKTTLLKALLAHEALAGDGVIVNEFGDVGIDHALLEAGEEELVELGSGCLCCAARGDIPEAAARLQAQRPCARIWLETSGLADPAPILQTLIAAYGLEAGGLAATVDAVNGAETLERYPEAVKQAALADLLIVTKRDLAPAPDLEARLRRLNPGAEIVEASFGGIDPERRLRQLNPGAEIVEASFGALDPARLTAITPRLDAPDGHDHAAGISTFTLRRTEPVPAVALTLFLETLADAAGPDLLRLKGLVRIAEAPERPVVVHGVQHVFHPLERLARWPGADRSTRIVVIGRGIRQDWAEALMDALIEEVERCST